MTVGPSAAGERASPAPTSPFQRIAVRPTVDVDHALKRRRTVPLPSTDTLDEQASFGVKLTVVSSPCPSPLGLKGSGEIPALASFGRTVSSTTVAVAGRATPFAVSALMTTAYAPSG